MFCWELMLAQRRPAENLLPIWIRARCALRKLHLPLICTDNTDQNKMLRVDALLKKLSSLSVRWMVYKELPKNKFLPLSELVKNLKPHRLKLLKRFGRGERI